MTAESDWVLDGAHRELQQQLIDGWVGAARALSAADAPAIDAWRIRRLAHASSGTSRMRVGHVDLVALPR